jgi:hypothetical protein
VALASVGCIFRVFIEGAVLFIGKGSLAIGAGVVNNIKGVNGRDLR